MLGYPNYKVFLTLFCSLIVTFGSVRAEPTTILVSDPGSFYRIATPALCGDDRTASNVPGVIAKNLTFSGFFKVLESGSYVEGTSCPKEGSSYEDWKLIGAEWLVQGKVESLGGGNLEVSLYLIDVARGESILGKAYKTSIKQYKDVAHKFSNLIMEKVTGTYGPFGSQIVFSGKVGRFKELFMVGMTGDGLRQITYENALALSASFDSNGERVLYNSFRKRVPDVFMLNVASGLTRQVTHTPWMEVGGAFATKNSLITSVSRDGRTSLLELDINNGTKLRSITRYGRSIDVSPTLSPNGSEIAFCSDRSGSPQIYVSNVSGADSARRISFTGSSYCTSPDWSPTGDRIAFVCRSDGGFQIFISDADGRNTVQVTNWGDNEDPSWSGDGRYLVYSTNRGSGGKHGLAVMLAASNMEGTNVQNITNSYGGDTQPDWGPALR